MKRASIIVVMMFSIAIGAAAQDRQRELKPGFNLFSKDQDVQIGKEAAAQVEQEAKEEGFSLFCLVEEV